MAMLVFNAGPYTSGNEETEQILSALNEIDQKLDSLGRSGAADILLSLVPIIGIVFGTTLLFFYFYWQHQQKKELIKHDQYIPYSSDRWRTVSLLMGCLSGVIGVAISILFLLLDGLSYALFGGLIPFATGMGFLFFYFLSHKKE